MKPRPPSKKNVDKAKSMDNIRTAFTHPSTLQPGRRPQNQVPAKQSATNGSGGGTSGPLTVADNNGRLDHPSSSSRQAQLSTSIPVPSPMSRPLPTSSATLGNADGHHASRTPIHNSNVQIQNADSHLHQMHAESTPPLGYRHQRQLPSYDPPSDTDKSPGLPASSHRLSSNAATSERESDMHNNSEHPSGDLAARTSAQNPQNPAHNLSTTGTDPSLPQPGSRRTSVSKAYEEEMQDANWAMEITRMFDDLDQGTAMPAQRTIIPPLKLSEKDHIDKGLPQPPPPLPSTPSLTLKPLHNANEDSDSEGEDTGTLWNTKPMAEKLPSSVIRPKSILRGPQLKVHIEKSPEVHHVSLPSTDSSSSATMVPPHPTRVAPPPPIPSPSIRQKGRVRGSTFTDMRDYTWAPRPPPEDVYERLEDFFPNFDLDQPVIEASSGGTSPTLAENAPVPPLPANDKRVPDKAGADPSTHDKSRIRAKKSIRIVAQEHKKRIDRTSRADSSSAMSNVMRKRSTKLWGSRLEEVTRERPVMPQPAPDSPSSAPKRRCSACNISKCDLPTSISDIQVGSR